LLSIGCLYDHSLEAVNEDNQLVPCPLFSEDIEGKMLIVEEGLFQLFSTVKTISAVLFNLEIYCQDRVSLSIISLTSRHSDQLLRPSHDSTIQPYPTSSTITSASNCTITDRRKHLPLSL
jgi:hypothetical protein